MSLLPVLEPHQEDAALVAVKVPDVGLHPLECQQLIEQVLVPREDGAVLREHGPEDAHAEAHVHHHRVLLGEGHPVVGAGAAKRVEPAVKIHEDGVAVRVRGRVGRRDGGIHIEVETILVPEDDVPAEAAPVLGAGRLLVDRLLGSLGRLRRLEAESADR
jgi:hypothetical protein